MFASTATRHGRAGRGDELGGFSFSFSCIKAIIFYTSYNKFLRFGVYAIIGK
jgi:hypothetical protein